MVQSVVIQMYLKKSIYNIMFADGLATTGARSSAGMVLTKFAFAAELFSIDICAILWL